MSDVPPPLSAKEFFTPELLRDHTRSTVGILTDAGYNSSLFMEAFGPLSSVQIALLFFGTPDYPPSTQVL